MGLESGFICPDVLRHHAMVFPESATAYPGHRMMYQIQAEKVTVGVRAIPLSPPWVSWSLWWKWEEPREKGKCDCDKRRENIDIITGTHRGSGNKASSLSQLPLQLPWLHLSVTQFPWGDTERSPSCGPWEGSVHHRKCESLFLLTRLNAMFDFHWTSPTPTPTKQG